MIVPDTWLREYLATTGLGSRLAILAGRFPVPRTNLEAALELSLEASWLFERYPFPESLETRILASLDDLAGDVLVRATGPNCGASGMELWSAGTSAELLHTIRLAWSRAFSASAAREPAWPAVSVIERGSVSAGELAQADRWTEPLPGGRSLLMSPQELKPVLEAAATGSGSAQLPETGAYIRYALGRHYNGVVAPGDPFEFLELLVPGSQAGRALAEHYDALCQASGKADGQIYAELARRSLELEWSQAERSDSGSGGRDERGSAQQLVGSPSSPGRAVGTLYRASAGTTPTGVPRPDAPVLVCDRFHRGLLELKPVAVVEREGGRLGAGALLARSQHLPCVSGVRDANVLLDGSIIRVDGWLGLVSVTV